MNIPTKAGQVRRDRYQIYYVIGPTHNISGFHDVIVLWSEDGAGVKPGQKYEYGHYTSYDEVLCELDLLENTG